MLAHLTAEIDRLGKRAVTVDDLEQLPWNLAVIEEAMRLHPPAYTTGRQTTEEVVLAGHRLPKDSLVVIYIRGIHRRADYYPAPHAFKPERMLGATRKARPRHHYMPFGAGPRVCIGAHFALLEAQHMRLSLVSSQVMPEPLITLRPRGGMPAVVELR